MSLNLVDLVKSQLGGNPPRQLDSPADPQPEAVKSAMNAAVPALLAGLSEVASKPDGAAALRNALDQPPAGSGGPQLSSLLGADRLAGLVGALAAFTGLSAETANRLLGSLWPTVLDVFRQQCKSLGLDSGGVAGLLAGQQQNIRDALPSGLAPLLSRIPGWSGFATPPTVVPLAGGVPAGGTPASSGLPRWLLPVAIVVMAAVLFVQWRKHQATADNGNAAMVAQEKPVDWVLDEVYRQAGVAVAGTMKGAMTQAEALPRLTEWGATLAPLYPRYETLPEPAKARVREVAQVHLKEFVPVAEEVLRAPGTNAAFKATLEHLVMELKRYSK
jgi:hypothetical protein